VRGERRAFLGGLSPFFSVAELCSTDVRLFQLPPGRRLCSLTGGLSCSMIRVDDVDEQDGQSIPTLT